MEGISDDTAQNDVFSYASDSEDISIKEKMHVF